MKSTHSKAHELSKLIYEDVDLQDYKVYLNDMQGEEVCVRLAQVHAQEEGLEWEN